MFAGLFYSILVNVLHNYRHNKNCTFLEATCLDSCCFVFRSQQNEIFSKISLYIGRKYFSVENDVVFPFNKNVYVFFHLTVFDLSCLLVLVFKHMTCIKRVNKHLVCFDSVCESLISLFISGLFIQCIWLLLFLNDQVS